MNRRDLIAGSAALAAMATVKAREAMGQSATSAAGPRQYYLIRRYKLVNNGVQNQAAAKYFAESLVPALGRMGIGPVGVFAVAYGDTPMTVVIMPSADAVKLATVDYQLMQDAVYVKSSTGFLSPSVAQAPFERVDSTLSQAFASFPTLMAPSKEPHILQMRTYESATYGAHLRKVEMMEDGEIAVFKAAGAQNVFFASNLIGGRLPSLTYMLAHKDLATLDATWKNFMANPDWKKLQATPKYSTEPLVSHLENLVLTPTAASQI